MTDNKIIKALECCAGEHPCNDDCPGNSVDCELEKYALDLINRQKAELKEKDIEIDILVKKKDAAYDEVAELKAEVEKLKNAYKQCAWERDTFLEELKTAKSEAIKEFAERLKKYAYGGHSISSYESVVIDVKIVDNLVKELTENLRTDTSVSLIDGHFDEKAFWEDTH